jgi:hypothetical protein
MITLLTAWPVMKQKSSIPDSRNLSQQNTGRCNFGSGIVFMGGLFCIGIYLPGIV